MGSYSDDIRKYINGELTPAEMHALEQKALRDPFLADALEGAEHAGADHFGMDIDILHRTIHDKTKHKSRIITFSGWQMYLGIAASLLVLVVSSLLVLSIMREQDGSRNKQALSDTVTPAPGAAADSASDSLLTYNRPEEKPAEQTPRRPPVREEQERHPAEQPVTVAPLASDEIIPEEKVAEADLAEAPTIARDSAISTTSAIPLAGAGERVEESKGKTRAANRQASERSEVAGKAATAPERLVRGRVVSAEDHTGLAGVNIVIRGTNTGTITNAEGEYEIPVHSSDATLVFSFIGLTSEEVPVGASNEVNVAMESDASQLSEVVVTGYGGDYTGGDDHFPVIEMAAPQGGRKAFKQYLEQQLQYPQQALANKVEGKVTVQFTVLPNGQLSDFKVLKGLGFGCDEEVIRLIKEGPAWAPTRKDNQAVRDNVRIRLKFDLPERK